MKSKNFLITALLVVIIGLIAWGFVIRAVAFESTESWPAFTMVYQEYRYPNGHPESLTKTPVTSATWKLEYVSIKEWKHILIEGSSPPFIAGDWQSYDGKFYRVYSGLTGLTDEIFNEEGVSPNAWLSPGFANEIQNFGYTLVSNQPLEEGRIRYQLVAPNFECAEKPPICPSSSKTQYTYTQEYVFTNDYGIPVEVIGKLDDIVISKIVVTELIVQHR